MRDEDLARRRKPERLSELEVTRAIARTPQDHFVIWTGDPAAVRPGSLRSRALALVDEPWRPIDLRALLLRAAQIDGETGLHPEVVRAAIRMHQGAQPAICLLARRTIAGDYLAVWDVPYPARLSQPLTAGAPLLDRDGRTFLDAPPPALRRVV